MPRLSLKPYREAFRQVGSAADARENLSRFLREEKTVVRSLKSAALCAVALDLLFFMGGRATWGWGFLIGALVSLFSLVSLLVIVPILFRPHASPHVKGLLLLTLLLKLPFYAVALSMVTPRHGIEPLAAGVGVALIPLVLTFRTAAALLLEELRDPRTASAPKPKAAALPKLIVPSLPEVEPQPVLYPQSRLPQAVYPVREGA